MHDIFQSQFFKTLEDFATATVIALPSAAVIAETVQGFLAWFMLIGGAILMLLRVLIAWKEYRDHGTFFKRRRRKGDYGDES